MMQTFSEALGPLERRAVDKAAVGGRFEIRKANDEKRLAFGWASIAIEEDGEQLTDLAGDKIDPEELEAAAYNLSGFTVRVEKCTSAAAVPY